MSTFYQLPQVPKFVVKNSQGDSDHVEDEKRQFESKKKEDKIIQRMKYDFP